MPRTALLPILMAILATLLASCGDKSLSSTRASHPAALAPLFDAGGFLLRDSESELPIYELRSGAVPFLDLRPLFNSRGGVRRCPTTECPLYLLVGESPTLVRVAGS